MTVAELAKVCIEAINHPDWSLNYVNLKIPIRSKRPPYGRVRLCGRRGPLGKIVGSAGKPGEEFFFVMFEAAAILKFLERETKP